MCNRKRDTWYELPDGAPLVTLDTRLDGDMPVCAYEYGLASCRVGGTHGFAYCERATEDLAALGGSETELDGEGADDERRGRVARDKSSDRLCIPDRSGKLPTLIPH